MQQWSLSRKHKGLAKSSLKLLPMNVSLTEQKEINKRKFMTLFIKTSSSCSDLQQKSKQRQAAVSLIEV